MANLKFFPPGVALYIHVFLYTLSKRWFIENKDIYMYIYIVTGKGKLIILFLMTYFRQKDTSFLQSTCK